MQGRNTTAPEDFGGVGPVAEGLAAWLLALLPIIALTRWIGRPHEGRDAPIDETVQVRSDRATDRAAADLTSAPTERPSSRS